MTNVWPPDLKTTSADAWSSLQSAYRPHKRVDRTENHPASYPDLLGF